MSTRTRRGLRAPFGIAFLGFAFLAGTIAVSAIPLTSRWKGDQGNSAKIKQTTDAVAGITVTLVQPVSGATNGSVVAAIAALGATKYDRIIYLGNDSTALALLEAAMVTRFTSLRTSSSRGFTIAASPASSSNSRPPKNRLVATWRPKISVLVEVSRSS